MIVRCGRCRSELEVSGPGEFVCPACGTRNSVRGPAGAQPGSFGGSPFDLGGATPPPPPEAPAPGVTWSVCPECSWRFAHGESTTVTCPNCRATLERSGEGLRATT